MRVTGLVAASDDFRPFATIPAGSRGFRVAGKVVIEEDCRVYGAAPHARLGTKVRITMTPPGGKEQVVVEIGEWDYAWRELYRLAEPLDVKAGTVFTVEAEYDNSAKNPLNPFSPPNEVKSGEGTTDEMLIGFLSAHLRQHRWSCQTPAPDRPEALHREVNHVIPSQHTRTSVRSSRATS